MPGRDGTGPMGMGPATGRGRGFCAVPMRDWSGPYGGRGRGRGRGWFGRGFGRRWAAYSYGYGYPYSAPYGGNPYGPELTPQKEADMLKEEARNMQEEIKAINNRISELESAARREK